MPPSIVLPTPSWAPPSTRIDDAVGVEGAEALAGDRAAVELEAGEHLVARLGPVLEDPRAGDRPRELGAEHAVVGVGRRAGTRCGRCGREQTSRRQRGDLRRGLLRLHPDRPGDDEAGLGARLGDSSATGRSSGSRSRNSSSGVISGARSIVSLARDLLEQVVAADQVLGAVVAERGDDLLDLLAHRLEEAGAALGGAVDLLRGELLQPVLLRPARRSRSGSRCRRGRCRAGSRGRSCSRG